MLSSKSESHSEQSSDVFELLTTDLRSALLSIVENSVFEGDAQGFESIWMEIRDCSLQVRVIITGSGTVLRSGSRDEGKRGARSLSLIKRPFFYAYTGNFPPIDVLSLENLGMESN